MSKFTSHNCQRPSGNIISSDLKNNINMATLLGDFGTSESTLCFDDDVSDLAKPEIIGRGFVKTGQTILEYQSFLINDFKYKYKAIKSPDSSSKAVKESIEEASKEISKDKIQEENLSNESEVEDIISETSKELSDEVKAEKIIDESEEEISSDVNKIKDSNSNFNSLEESINKNSTKDVLEDGQSEDFDNSNNDEDYFDASDNLDSLGYSPVINIKKTKPSIDNVDKTSIHIELNKKPNKTDNTDIKLNIKKKPKVIKINIDEQDK